MKKNPLYDGDTLVWNALSDYDKLEALRLHYCTGPCGQSSMIGQIRSRTDEMLRKCQGLVGVLVEEIRK